MECECGVLSVSMECEYISLVKYSSLLCSVMYPEAPKSTPGIYAGRIGAMQGNGGDRKVY